MKIVETSHRIAQTPKDYLLVGMDEYLISEDDMLTYGMANCVGIVAHNAKTRKGLVGHFIVGTELITKAIPAISDIGHYRDTSVWIGGTSLTTDPAWGEQLEPMNNGSIEERQFVLDEFHKLSEAGFLEDTLTVDWGQLNKVTELRLYTAEARLLVNKSRAGYIGR